MMQSISLLSENLYDVGNQINLAITDYMTNTTENFNSFGTTW